MGCCNPSVTPTGLPADPSQHVNYALGMVLGVDDFQQEFAYQSGRDQWLARDGLGYGTLSGLAVVLEDAGSQGWRLRVTAGSALVPSGKLVCVGSDQCAVIDQWLVKPANAALVTRLLAPGAPPPSPPPAPLPGASGTVALHLVLCYADCQTRPVPIPGEPCRSEEDLMQPSRVADDYRLELREIAPLQVEEDALRDWVRWLRMQVQVVDASLAPAGTEADWLLALRDAVRPWLDADKASPPLSPPASFETLHDYLFDRVLPLQLAADQVGDFVRVALRFWVTELRWRWQALRCHTPQQADSDCLLLASVRLPVHWVGGSPSGVWMLTGSPPLVRIDESRRPVLAHARLLQELGSWSAAAAAAQAGASALRLAVVSTKTDLALDASQQVVLCEGGQAITLPACDPGNLGRTYVVKSLNADSKLVTTGSDTLSGPTASPELIKKGNAKTVLSDGKSTWHVIATVA